MATHTYTNSCSISSGRFRTTVTHTGDNLGKFWGLRLQIETPVEKRLQEEGHKWDAETILESMEDTSASLKAHFDDVLTCVEKLNPGMDPEQLQAMRDTGTKVFKEAIRGEESRCRIKTKRGRYSKAPFNM